MQVLWAMVIRWGRDIRGLGGPAGLSPPTAILGLDASPWMAELARGRRGFPTVVYPTRGGV